MTPDELVHFPSFLGIPSLCSASPGIRVHTRAVLIIGDSEQVVEIEGKPSQASQGIEYRLQDEVRAGSRPADTALP